MGMKDGQGHRTPRAALLIFALYFGLLNNFLFWGERVEQLKNKQTNTYRNKYVSVEPLASPLLLTFLFWKVRLREGRSWLRSPCRLMSRRAPEAGSSRCHLSQTHTTSLPGSPHSVFYPEFDLEKLSHFKLHHRLDSLRACPENHEDNCKSQTNDITSWHPSKGGRVPF